MRLLFTIAVLVLATSVCATASDVDDLPRHGLLGAVLAAKDSTVSIVGVIPGSAAARAGLAAGDAILSVDGTAVATTAEAIAKLHKPAGTTVRLAIRRAGRTLSVGATLLPAPLDQDERVDTLYRSVEIDGTRRRILLTVPRGVASRRPGLLIVGGIGCFTVDTGSSQDAYRSIARDASLHGFVTLRLEKSGIGDSQGPPCSTVDFTTEMRGYAVALKWFLESPLVDRSAVYVLGHSIGGVIAPRLAREYRAAGVVVAETVGINWFEYELINTRRQLALSGEPPAKIDEDMKGKAVCTYRLEIQKQTYERILRDLPGCKPHLDVYPVPAAYMQEVAALNVAEPWARLDAPALAIYGESDFITDESDHRSIVAIVNAGHPGTARLVTITGMDHYLARAASQKASLDRLGSGGPATYDTDFSIAVVAWLCAHASCSSAPSP